MNDLEMQRATHRHAASNLRPKHDRELAYRGSLFGLAHVVAYHIEYLQFERIYGTLKQLIEAEAYVANGTDEQQQLYMLLSV